jgi:hypothetical protein
VLGILVVVQEVMVVDTHDPGNVAMLLAVAISSLQALSLESGSRSYRAEQKQRSI